MLICSSTDIYFFSANKTKKKHKTVLYGKKSFDLNMLTIYVERFVIYVSISISLVNTNLKHTNYHCRNQRAKIGAGHRL